MQAAILLIIINRTLLPRLYSVFLSQLSMTTHYLTSSVCGDEDDDDDEDINSAVFPPKRTFKTVLIHLVTNK